ncbi:MAG: STAS/SEC14 domain-containing protein [Myxococcales bacterium]|nr:STAS/SEC14 domain-containing protein [Myxococcales bacterium]
MERRETDTCIYILRDDGIIQQTVKPGQRQDLPDAEKNMAVFDALADGQKRRLLVDLRRSGPTGPGVREFYAKHTEKLVAAAMIVEGSLSEMIGNFFIRLNRPKSPTRLFNDEAAALAWLKSQ